MSLLDAYNNYNSMQSQASLDYLQSRAMYEAQQRNLYQDLQSPPTQPITNPEPNPVLLLLE